MNCEWFALCDNPATTTELGPIITNGKPEWGQIPICETCQDKLHQLETT